MRDGFLRRSIERLWKKRLVRFTAGGSMNMLSRLILAYLLKRSGISIWLNYGIVHLFTLAFGYSYHSLVTFHHRMSLRSFWRFLLSVIALRITDYVLVVGVNQLAPVRDSIRSVPAVGGYIADNLFMISILVVSSIMFVLRYMLFRKVTFQQDGEDVGERIARADDEEIQAGIR
jgi:hypothetical protein